MHAYAKKVLNFEPANGIANWSKVYVGKGEVSGYVTYRSRYADA